MTRSLYALCIGINNYLPPVKPLKGCVNDVYKVAEYLDGLTDFKVEISTLFNTYALKESIVGKLAENLQKAKDGDVVFFYFSGHGMREKAGELFFNIEEDKRLETYICYDSIVRKGDSVSYNLLADKELHYVLSKYSNPKSHVVVVFDSCHSGGITRNMSAATNLKNLLEKRHRVGRKEALAPMREWQHFVFARDYSLEEIEKKGWYNLLPARPHISLSACQNNESAFEYNSEGIFTKNLIDVLHRTDGTISYHNLMSRVRGFVLNQFGQQPDMYTPSGAANLRHYNFLGQKGPSGTLTANCQFKKGEGWCIDIGSVHGFSLNSFKPLLQAGGAAHPVTIKNIGATLSSLSLEKPVLKQLDKSQAYKVILDQFFSGPITVFDETKTIKSSSAISAVKGKHNAQYLVKQRDEEFYICYNDDAERPAVAGVSKQSQELVERLTSSLNHIAQWEFVRQFSSNKDHGPLLEINITRSDESGREIQFSRNHVELDYSKEGQNYGGAIKMCVTNKSAQRLYCAALYLSMNFQIYDLFDGSVRGLDPEERVWIFNGADLEFTLERQVIDYNFPYSTFHFKVLAASEPFDVSHFVQPPLPEPKLNMRGSDTKVKGKLEVEKLENDEFYERLLTFNLRNPHYKGGE